MRLCNAFVFVAVLAGVLAGIANAGTVGVTGSIRGAGAMISVEGGPYTCSLTNGYNQNALSSCERQPFEAAFESWVWFKAVPSTVPAGNWSFTGWLNCDTTRITANGVECAVHSGAFSLDERNPVALFADTVTPDISFPTAPTGTVTTTNASIGFSSSDPTATFRCRIDNAGSFTPCGPGSYSFGDGPHTFRVVAVDPSGHQSAEVSRSWTVDTVAPQVNITSGPNPGSVTSSTTASFTVTASESAQFFCSLDGAPATSCGGPGITSIGRAYPGLANGSHTFTVYASDTRLTGASVSRTWTVDTVPPSAPTFAGGPSGPWGSASASFSFTGPVDAASFRCSLDGAAATACTSPVVFPSLGDGAHTVQVTALDVAGNESAAAARTWTTDTVAPAAPSITGGPSGITVSRSAILTFTGPGDAASFRCRLDGAAATACTSPVAYTALADGAHTVTVTALDAAGNESATAPRAWTVDGTAPNARLLRGPAARTTARVATFRFSSTEAGTFQCKLDRGAWKACGSPKTYRKLKPGRHTFQVRARDAAGNLDATPAKKTWRIR
jgi:hypothetical protein